MLRSLVPSLALLAALGCSSAEIVGAELTPAGRAPESHPIARWRAGACVDASGRAFPYVTSVLLAADAERRPLLIVSRPSYDSLVLHKPANQGGESVFQVVLADGDGARVLQDYRVPRSGKGAGRMAVSREFSQGPAPEGQVSARIGRIAFACKLELGSEP